MMERRRYLQQHEHRADIEKRCGQRIAALHSADPNWGRIVQAVGAAFGGRERFAPPLAVDITLEGIKVCSAGAAIPYDEGELAEALKAKEVEYEIALPGDGAETEVFFSDLSHEYVTINADYTT